MNEYPGYEERRKKFVKNINDIKRRACIIHIIILVFLIILFLLFLYSLNNDFVGIYNGLNKGIYFLNCGFEFVGDFGPFCGNY